MQERTCCTCGETNRLIRHVCSNRSKPEGATTIPLREYSQVAGSAEPLPDK